MASLASEHLSKTLTVSSSEYIKFATAQWFSKNHGYVPGNINQILEGCLVNRA